MTRVWTVEFGGSQLPRMWRGSLAFKGTYSLTEFTQMFDAQQFAWRKRHPEYRLRNRRTDEVIPVVDLFALFRGEPS